jgi:hypothetical protein
MRLSVVVVSYGVRDLLERCLSSIGAAAEVIVVDNASPDGSAAMVRERFGSMRLLELPENRGFAAAVNAGARAAGGDALLLLNPDAELPAGALPQMARALESRPDAWAVGFRQVDGEGRFQLSLGLRPTLATELLRRTVQRRLDRGDRWLAAALDRLLSFPVRVPWVAASALLVRRHAFDRVGGFDERFFLYFEDVDFCLRLRAAGGQIYYDPSVTIVHHRGASGVADRDRVARAYRESQLLFWEKHHGPWARRLVRTYLKVRGVAP